MSSPYHMQYYHSYQGNDSFLGCHCCTLKDGGELIVLTVKGGVEYIIRKDGKQRIMSIPLDEKSNLYCIGVSGFSIKNHEFLIFLMKKVVVASYSKTKCYLMVITIPSSSDIKEEDVSFPKLRCCIDFIPTFMKCVTISSCGSSGQNLFVFLGKQDGSAAVLNCDSDPSRCQKLTHSNLFNDFFPRTSSPMMCMDFIELSDTRRFWAFGYANGLVCIFSISTVQFENRAKLKTIVLEFDPIDDQPLARNTEKIEKLVLATHIPSPVLCVKLLASPIREERPRVDLVVSGGQDLLVQFPDFLQRGLTLFQPLSGEEEEGVNAMACCGESGNCTLVCGDMMNRVRVFKRRDAAGDVVQRRDTTNDVVQRPNATGEMAQRPNATGEMAQRPDTTNDVMQRPNTTNDLFEKEAVMHVNDCVYAVWKGDPDLVVLTRQGLYIYSCTVSQQTHDITPKHTSSKLQSVVPATITFSLGHRSRHPDRRSRSPSLNALLSPCVNKDTPSRWFAATAKR